MSTVAYPGECAKFQWLAFGGRNGRDFLTAIEAWHGQSNRNFDRPPLGISVPIWFSWTKDWRGHAAVWLADGRVLSSPVSGSKQGQNIFPSIDALINAFGGGMTYLGWAEWMDDTVVVEPVQILVGDEDDIMAIYLRATNNSSPLDAKNPGTSRIWAGDGRVINGAKYSGVWERSEDGTVRRLFPDEWAAIQRAYAAAGKKVPYSEISGNELEKMYLVTRAAPK